MAGNNIAINIQIKNIKQVSDLKESLKQLRKEQRDYEKQVEKGKTVTEASAKGYVKNEKAIRKQSTALRETKKELNGVANASKKGTKGSNSLSRSFVKAAAAIAVVVAAFRILSNAISSVVSTFTEFEFVMAKVHAVSGATDEEFAKLTQSAEALGRSTFFTASQVGELQLAYSKLGFTADEILNAQKATLDLATATGTDLARAAQVAGASIRGFQIDAADAGRVVDVMAVAFSSSALDIEKWNTSMTKVAPIAAMAGFSLEGTAAIMGKLTDTGIEASIAGTSLRNILLKMQDPSSDLTKTIGHTVTNLDGMLVAFQQLQDEGTDLTDVLGFMDVRQVAAFSTMLEGADDIRELRDSLLEANGEGARMAEMVGDTLQGSFLKVKSAAEGVSISIMKNFGDALKVSGVRLAAWLNIMSKDENKHLLKEVIDNIKKAIKWTAAWVIGLKVLKVITIAQIAVQKAFAANVALTGVAMNTARGFAIALGVGIRTIGKAIATTGIGLLVIGLGELAAHFIFAQTQAEISALALDEYGRTIVDIIDVEKSLAKLEDDSIRKTSGKIKIVDRLVDKYKDLETTEEERIRILRRLKKISKDFFGELKEGTKDYKNLEKSADDYKKKIIEIAKIEAGKQLIIDVESEKLVVQAQIKREEAKLKKLVVKRKEERAAYDIVKIQPFGHFKDEALMSAKENVKASKLAIKLLKETLVEAEFLEKEVTELLQSIDVNALLDLESDDDDSGKKEVDAFHEMTEKINSAVSAANTDAIKNENEKQKAILAAQLKGVNEYMAQFKTAKSKLKPEYIAAGNRRAQILHQQEKLLFNIEQTAIEDRRKSAKQGAVELLLDKTKTNKEVEVMVEGVATTITLTHKNLNDTLNKMDVASNAELLANAKLYGQDKNKIEQKIAAQSIKNKQDNLSVAVETVDDGEQTDTNTLDLMLANDQITEAQHQQYMLQMQRSYLNDKLAILQEYNQDASDIIQSLAENEIEQIEAKKEALLGYMGIIGSLGDSLQGLADDEEESSAVRDAGIAITQAAAIAEQFLTLQNQLAAIGIYLKIGAKNKDKVATLLSIPLAAKSAGASALEGGAAAGAAGGFFMKGIGKAFASNPWAGLAILATAIGIIVAIRNMFKGADMGGGGGGGNTDVDDINSSDRASDGVYSYSAGAYEDGGIIPEYAAGGITNEGGGNTRNVMGMEIPTLGGGIEGSDLGGDRGSSDTSRPTGGSREPKGGYWTSREDAWKFKGGAGSEMDNKRTQCGEGYVYNKATGRCVKDNRMLWEFRGGGLVRGKSHAQGGEKFSVGGRVSELEGGEAVINKRSTKMFKSQLSAINQAGGGVKFADGGITSKMKYADGGLLNSPAFAQQKFSGEAKDTQTSQRVYVVEADISNSQRSVNVLEANATI